jgi:hypothetical protein
VYCDDDHQCRVDSDKSVPGVQETTSACPVDELLWGQDPRVEQAGVCGEGEHEHQWHHDESKPGADPGSVRPAHGTIPMTGRD